MLAPLAARNVTRGSSLAESVELATSFWARFMGLMGRRALPSGRGLWIAGGNGIHMFFMRFAIDAVFLSRRGSEGGRRVVGLRRALPPWVGLVPLVRGADGVLELPVGAIDASGTQLGDEVRIG
ncbi:MAG TPA: DUF192 domain-containing protein [Candidatus Limnocylindrales bacterium]|nr:DUF192 domain-containing protein [Candidatus Limnocylindrales bacterium]